MVETWPGDGYGFLGVLITFGWKGFLWLRLSRAQPCPGNTCFRAVSSVSRKREFKRRFVTETLRLGNQGCQSRECTQRCQCPASNFQAKPVIISVRLHKIISGGWCLHLANENFFLQATFVFSFSPVGSSSSATFSFFFFKFSVWMCIFRDRYAYVSIYVYIDTYIHTCFICVCAKKFCFYTLNFPSSISNKNNCQAASTWALKWCCYERL